MKANAPCYGCEDRRVGCHGYCKTFLTWQDQHVENKERENQKRNEFNAGTTGRYWNEIRKKYGER